MTREELIALAKEAGVSKLHIARNGVQYSLVSLAYPELEHFAALVAAKEREECAKLADSMNTFGEPPDIGAAIRGRG